jgi:hypothetical protein
MKHNRMVWNSRDCENILDASVEFADSTLADLYDPDAMQKQLLDAHRALDAAVDLCYRPTDRLQDGTGTTEIPFRPTAITPNPLFRRWPRRREKRSIVFKRSYQNASFRI